MTLVQRLENGIDLIKSNLKLITITNLALSVVFLFCLPFLQGVENLDAVSSATCLESFVSIIGIILIVPILAPEEPVEINEIVSSKSMTKLIPYAIRLASSLFISFIIIGVFTLFLKYNGCNFPLTKYMIGTFLSAAFLGSFGLCFSAITGNTIFGYMFSIGYLIFNRMSKNEYLGKFDVLSMQRGSFEEKYWLLYGSIALILITIMIKWLKRRLR
ncbi:ABC transporter permease protein [Gottschalkia acidurici 9a]|uniref:ABC transporter permease protein n=1 Tax=Gottschalkia acidurici (strain ATCC 7906 / DSM 604 / BCRC 14475 / CIP 104303 / KCTC 5404 / NCIMB 10678 / 9a) TaxID=1128398 RepID=K0B5C4_GOTA9|nr:hypothetical protein [Gottschalkia acidurici]AFS79746.1 ABC transporter permease protein [Gottschalkia acidurici 9a]